MTTVLDSWAVLRWLEGVQPAASRVEAAVTAGAHMSWINVGEVFYVVWRSSGEPAARQVVGDLRQRVKLDPATPDRVLAAARIKAEFPMAIGHAFAAATGVEHDAVVLAGDPELLDPDGPWRAEDLR